MTDVSKKEIKETKEASVPPPEHLSLDDSQTVASTLKLIAQDRKEIEIERKHALISILVKTSLDTDISATEVPILAVSYPTLIEVKAYMNHHMGVEPPMIEKPLRSRVMKDVCVDPFDADFIDRIAVNRRQLYDLILAANYMDIKSLLQLACAKVASLIKGQPLEKTKDILSVTGGGNIESSKEQDAKRDDRMSSAPPA